MSQVDLATDRYKNPTQLISCLTLKKKTNTAVSERKVGRSTAGEKGTRREDGGIVT